MTQNDMPDEVYVYADPHSIGDMGFTVKEPKEGYERYIHEDLTTQNMLSRQTVDVEGLRKKILPKSLLYDPCYDKGWNDCLDHLIQQGIIKEGE